jgi:hypothetical protein
MNQLPHHVALALAGCPGQVLRVGGGQLIG